jgi:hypothetical protein
VSSEILARHPKADLRVYALWTDRLLNDSRAQWDGGGLDDARVLHFWDGPDVAGQYFARDVPAYQGGTWDAYVLFGPDARWDTRPGPLLGSGSPVIAHTDELARQAAQLISRD